MEGFIQFGFFVSFAAMVILINVTIINFIRGSIKWKTNLKWTLIPLLLVCICIIVYPNVSSGL